MEVVFILVKAQRPANIGACARALKVMGFHGLRLVAPCDAWADQSYTAHGAEDVLLEAEVFEDLKAASDDCQLVVGTTARKRSSARTIVNSRRLPALIAAQHPQVEKVALVFGCEASGLSNQDLAICDLISSIPLNKPYPSCNLSQAVMIYAYELSQDAEIQANSSRKSFPHPNELSSLKSKLHDLMIHLGMRFGSPLFVSVMDRIALLNRDDREIIFSISNFIEKKLSHKSSE